MVPLGRGHQGLDHVVADLVGQVARGHRAGEVAQLAVGLVVEDQGVEDEGEQPGVVLQALRQPGRGRLAHGAVGVVELGEDLLDAQRLAPAVVLEGEADRRETVSSKSRTKAARPVTAFSSRIFSSGSLR